MRMWMVNPQIMCRKHLLAEHVECHMIVGALNKGRNLSTKGWLPLIDPSKVRERHEVLVREMILRGYNHKSPLPLPNIKYSQGQIDKEASLKLLLERCEECRRRYAVALHLYYPTNKGG